MTKELLDAIGLVTANKEAAQMVAQLYLDAKGLMAVPRNSSGPGGTLGPFTDASTPLPPPKPRWEPPFVPAWMDTWTFVFGEPPKLQHANPTYATLETANAIAARIAGATVGVIYQQVPLIIDPQYEIIGHGPKGEKKVNAGVAAGKYARSEKKEDVWKGIDAELKLELGLL